MEIEYSCFISYRRFKYGVGKTFIEELVKAIKAYLEPQVDLGVYIDENIDGGYIEANVLDAIKKSICMILIYTPTYFNKQSVYCTQEYLLMELIEEKRFTLLNGSRNNKKDSFIIPIIFRGPESLPEVLKNQLRKYYDLSQYTLVDPNIMNNSNYVDLIETIVKYIFSLHDKYINICEDSDYSDLTFPSKNEAMTWLRNINPKNVTQQDFPRGFGAD